MQVVHTSLGLVSHVCSQAKSNHASNLKAACDVGGTDVSGDMRVLVVLWSENHRDTCSGLSQDSSVYDLVRRRALVCVYCERICA